MNESSSLAAESDPQDSEDESQVKTSWIANLKKEEAVSICKRFYEQGFPEGLPIKELQKCIRKLIKEYPKIGQQLKSEYDPIEQEKSSKKPDEKPTETTANLKTQINPKNSNNKEMSITTNIAKSMVRPDPFDGKSNVQTFLKKFEYAANVNGWDDDKKKEYLPSFLTATAFDFYAALDDKKLITTWDLLKKSFKERYGKLANIAELELQTRKLEPTESVTEYLTSVVSLCNEADDKMSNERIINYVLRGLSPELVSLVVPMKSQNLDELQRNLNTAEYALKINEQTKKANLALEIEKIKQQLSKLNLDEDKNNNESLIEKLTNTISEKLKEKEKNKEIEKKETVNVTRDFHDNPGRGNKRGRGNYRNNGQYNNNGYNNRYNNHYNNRRGRGNRRGGYRNNRGTYGYGYQQIQWAPVQQQQQQYGYYQIPQQPAPAVYQAIEAPAQQPRAAPSCYNCNQGGHIAKNCPNRPKN